MSDLPDCRRRRAIVAASALALILGGCDAGDDEARPAVPRERPSATTAAALVQPYRAGIEAALARDQACTAVACSTPAGLLRRADALAAAVVPLDDALAGTPASKAEALPAATAAGAFRHSVRQLDTCFELSAQKHGGVPALADCQGPIADYDRAVALVRTAVRGN
jgi:hypothetical protein